MREVFIALKSGELTKFSSRHDISSEVLHLSHFIFCHDPLFSARNSKKHKVTYDAVMLEHTLFVKQFSLIYEIVLQTSCAFCRLQDSRQNFILIL